MNIHALRCLAVTAPKTNNHQLIALSSDTDRLIALNKLVVQL
jgi:hypothetical protein